MTSQKPQPSPPMPIMFVMPSFRGGGAERVFLSLAKALSDSHIPTSITVVSAVGAFAKSLPERVVINDLSRPTVLSSFPRLLKALNSSPRSILVVCLTHLNVVTMAAVLLSRVDHRIVLTEHNPYSVEKANLSSIHRILLDRAVSFTYGLADKVLAVSRGVKEDLVKSLRLGSDQVCVIYNPINVANVFSDSKNPETFSPLFGRGKDLIVSIGRLVPQKRFDLLIDALAIVHNSFPRTSLVIVGEGPEEARLRARVEDLGLSKHVKFAGFIDNPREVLQRARVFALASDFEGFGNVIVEALAVGVPVVATDCPSGPREILENGKYGKLVPTGSSKLLAEAIISELSTKLSSNRSRALARHALKFDTQVAYLQYLALFEELTTKN